MKALPRAFGPTLLVVVVASLAATGCVSTPPDTTLPPSTPPSLTVAQVEALVPAQVPDRAGWATDIHAGIAATGKEVTAERACAVVAIVGQESGFQADPRVEGLPRIVRQGLLARLKPLGPLAEPALGALLGVKVPGSPRTFGETIDTLRSERDLDRLFRTMANVTRNRMPGTFVVAQALSKLLGTGRFEDLNPITTAGSMQVKIARARAMPAFDGLDDTALREHLYTRAGGLQAGTHALLAYPARYDDVVYRFADYNAGPYASRNAAFQGIVSELTGRPLVLDGDLLAYDAQGEPREEESASLQALFAFTRPRGTWDSTVRSAARKEKSAEFEDTAIWDDVRAAYEEKTGRTPPYARLPEVTLASPKLRGNRSTAWFASSVKRRYEACRSLSRGRTPEGSPSPR